MVEKKEVAKLFKNNHYRRCSLYFYRDYITATEVIVQSKIPRSTVYNFLRVFKTEENEYDSAYLKTKAKIKTKPYKLTQKILVDWISSEIDLTREEEKVLTKILERKTVDRALRKGNESWLDVKTKLILPLVVLLPLSEETGLGKEFAFQKLPNQINALKGLTRKETEGYIRELQDSIRELEGKKLVGKLVRANLSISLDVTDLRNIIMDTARSTVNLFLDELKRTRKGKQAINRILKNLQRMYGLKRREIRKKHNLKF